MAYINVSTHVQSVFLVKVKKKIMVKKVRTFGTKVTSARNLARSAEDQALSRYLPPWYRVTAPKPNVKMLPSTNEAVRNVQG